VTAEEWAQIALRLDNYWSQPEFTEERSAAYFELLQDYPLERVEEALRELLSESLQYLPSLSVVLGKVEDNADPALRFEVMWSAVKAALRQEHAEAFLETEHPLYLRFLREQGEGNLRRVDESNTYAMHQLRQAWKELSGEFRAEARRGRVRKALSARPLIPQGGMVREGMRKVTPGAAQLPPGKQSRLVG
jgi:hypothetical protein